MSIISLFKFKEFKRLYLAGLLSEFGSFITQTALMIFIFELSSKNKIYLGLSQVFFLSFYTIGNLIGSPLTEHLTKKNVLIFCEVIRIPIIILMIFNNDVWTLMICNGLIAMFTGIFAPNKLAFINRLLPPEYIPLANGLSGSTFAFLNIICPFLGAYLYNFFNGITEVLIIDLLTYFLGIYWLIQITRDQKTINNKQGLVHEFKSGINVVKNRPDLIVMFNNVIILGFCIGILIPMILPFTFDVLNKGNKEYGQLMSAFGIGGMIGGFFVSKVFNKTKLGKIIIICTLLESVYFFTWIHVPIFSFSIFILLFWGTTVLTRITSQLNYVSKSVEKSYLTRIFGLLELSFIVPRVFASLVITFIGSGLSTYKLLLFTSSLLIFSIIIRFYKRSFDSLLKETASSQ